jgi:hypothetical protein
MSQKTLQKDAFKGGSKKFKFIDDSASSNDSSSDDSPPPKKPLTKIQTKFNKLDNTIKPPLKLHKPRKNTHTNLDYIFTLIGSFGLYQKIQFVLIGWLSLLPSMLAYSYVFIAASPEFTCKQILVITALNGSTVLPYTALHRMEFSLFKTQP